MGGTDLQDDQDDQDLQDHQDLLLLRVFEETLLELFAAGQIPGTTHTCLGQEHVPVAVADQLTVVRDIDTA